jgi:hypothetical protein
MIILNSQASKLQAKLAASGTSVNFFGVYADNGTAFTPGQNNVASNGTTYVDVVAAPQSGQRQVKSVYAYNGDAVSHTVTLAHYDGTTARILNIVTLVPGASIDLIPGRGLYGAITGPTNSTLAQTGTTLGLNLNNENVWAAEQVFNGGLNGYVSGTGLVPNAPYVNVGAYGSPFESGYFNGLVFNSSVLGRHETTLQQSAALDYGVHNVLELPNASGTLALTSDVIPYVAPGASGNVLTSNGSAWTSAALPADTDTLATVTARGAATSVASSFTGGLSASTVSTGSLNVQAPTTNVVGAIIKGTAGQTADLQQWQDSTGAVKTSINAIGDVIVHGTGTHSWGDGPLKIVNANNQTTFAVGDYTGATEGMLFLWAPAGQGNGSGIYFASGGGTKTGMFELDGAGNMVFRNSNAAGTYFDFNTSGIFFRDHTFTKVMTLSEAGNLNFGSAGDIGFLRSAAGVMKVTDGGSGDGTITAKSFRLKGYTVATLPTATQGDTAYVTDAVNPTYLGTLTGGGTVVTPVFYNGTAWVAY